MELQTNAQQQIVNDFWLRLDNAAKMYPVILNREFTAVFRMSVVLKERIKIRNLLEVVRTVEERFPYYKMQLKKGFFWYYLQHTSVPVAVRPDTGRMCEKFEQDRDHGLLLRILIQGKTLSIEFSHILTDGAGAMEFLKSLMITYFAKIGVPIPEDFSYFRPGNPVSEEELEDAYHRYFQKNLPGIGNLPKAFHLPFPLKKSARFYTTSITLNIDQVKAKAKSYPVSITVYLVAVYLYALQKLYKSMPERQKRKSQKILRIQVPVNLRNLFPSRTMRNFTLFILPEIDIRLGYYTFREIVKKVHHYMGLEKDEKMISRTISRNVRHEKNLVLSSIPLAIKKMILYSKYYSLGANLYSGELTNMGRVDFSAPVNARIETVKLIPPPPNKALKIDCAVISFNKKLEFTFGNITTTRAFENHFMEVLTELGLTYKTETPKPAL